MKRTIVNVFFKNGMWYVSKGRVTLLRLVKSEAITDARSLARKHQPSQLIIKKQNGQFQTEHTYPRSSDPKRHKG